MKNLIIKDLNKLGENDKTEENHILVISNKSFKETKKIIENMQYDYLICNNTLFDNEDNVLYSNYINFDSEIFLAYAHKNTKSPYIKITNPRDESTLTNSVKISIKYSVLESLGEIVNELERKYGLSYKFEKGFLNFYTKNGLKNIMNFLLQKNNYDFIFNYGVKVNPKKMIEDRHTDKLKNIKIKKYRR